MKLTTGVNFTNIFMQLFCTNKMISFFGKWRLASIKLIGWISQYILGNFIDAECWWNWTANFLPNAVRHRVFACRAKFGEIHPMSQTFRKSSFMNVLGTFCIELQKIFLQRFMASRRDRSCKARLWLLSQR